MSAPAAAELRVMRGNQYGERLRLPDRPRVIVGRSEECDVRLVGDAVSRQQFILERRVDGAWMLVDLGSANGTLLNGRPVTSTPLVDGDRIVVGGVECEFRCAVTSVADRTVLHLESAEPDSSLAVVEEHGAEGAAEALGGPLLAELAAHCTAPCRPDELAHRVLELAVRALGAERGALLGARREALEFVPLAVRRGADDPTELHARLPETTLSAAARGDRGLVLRILGPRPESAVLAPVPRHDGDAVLYVARCTPEFGAAAAATLTLIGRLAGAALDRGRLLDDQAAALHRLRLLVEGADDVVFACDDEGRLTYCNHPPGERAADGGELVGRALADCVPVADRARVLGALDAVLEGSEREALETTWQLGGGRGFPIRLSLAPLRNPNGVVVGARGEAQDQRELVALAGRRADVAGAGGAILGHGAGIQRVLRQVTQVAATDAPVLVCGETGTGKELVARALHEQSGRARGPFIPVNCSALPESLLEAELFGHARGAFTGAHASRPGLFAAAAGGTLFLDEIGELPLTMQARLLRVLEDKVVRPVGADTGVPVDVRVIAATHRDLAQLGAEGRFREDLRFRLDVVRIDLPPLRERPEDLPLLAERALDLAAADGGPRRSLTPAALAALAAYDWPGNVRELLNEVRRAALMTEGDVVDVDDLSPALRRVSTGAPRLPGEPRTLRAAQREAIVAALAATKGNRKRAAELLGIPRTTLYRRLREHGL